MALTEAELTAKITAIDTELDTLLTSSQLVNWQAGRVRVDKTSRVRELNRMRKVYLDQLNSIPFEQVTIADESAT